MEKKVLPTNRKISKKCKQKTNTNGLGTMKEKTPPSCFLATEKAT